MNYISFLYNLSWNNQIISKQNEFLLVYLGRFQTWKTNKKKTLLTTPGSHKLVDITMKMLLIGTIWVALIYNNVICQGILHLLGFEPFQDMAESDNSVTNRQKAVIVACILLTNCFATLSCIILCLSGPLVCNAFQMQLLIFC